MDSVVDEERVSSLMELAGAGQVLSLPEPRAFAAAATFALAGEAAQVSAFGVPTIDRAATGPARWLAISDSRVVTVEGDVHGGWWSGLQANRRFASSLTTIIRPRSLFDRVEFDSDGWAWFMRSENSTVDFLYDLTLTLSSSRSNERVVVYDGYQRGGSIVPTPASVFSGVRWLIGGTQGATGDPESS